jgi:hypothetical protein
MNFRVSSTFSVILLALGCPEHSSSSTNTQPALKCGCLSETTVLLKECSHKDSQSISVVSVVDLSSFMQNVLQTCSSLLSSIADKMKHEVEKAHM